MLSFLDLQAGLEKSLGLYTYDFNIGAAIYYIVYLFMEIPSALLIKRVGFRIVPVATFTFGVVTLATVGTISAHTVTTLIDWCRLRLSLRTEAPFLL